MDAPRIIETLADRDEMRICVIQYCSETNMMIEYARKTDIETDHPEGVIHFCRWCKQIIGDSAFWFSPRTNAYLHARCVNEEQAS